MNLSPLQNAALLSLLIATVTIGGWEVHLRSRDVYPSFDDGVELWSQKRAQV